MAIPKFPKKPKRLKLPSTGEEISFIPLTTEDELKLSMIKKTTEDQISKLDNGDQAMVGKQAKIMTEWIMNLLDLLQYNFPDLDLKTISEDDLEVIFLEMKRQSFDNKLSLVTYCPDCGGSNPIHYDLNKCKVEYFSGDREYVYEDQKFILKFPSFVEQFKFNELCEGNISANESLVGVLFIDKWIDSEGNEYDISKLDLMERIEWVKTLPSDVFHLFKPFIEAKVGMERIDLNVDHCKNYKLGDVLITKEQYTQMLIRNTELRANGEEPIDISDYKKCDRSYTMEVDRIYNFFL